MSTEPDRAPAPADPLEGPPAESRPTAEGWLAALLEQSTDAILTCGADGRVTSWSPGAARMLGYPAAEIVGRHVGALAANSRRPEWGPALAALARGESAAFEDAAWLRRDGRPIRVRLALAPLRDGEGRVTAVSIVARDVTARREAEEALRRSEERHRVVTDSVHGLIAYITREERYAFLNAVGARWYGLSREQVIGRHIREIIGEARYAAIREHYRRALELGEQVEFENRIARPHAPRRDMLVTLVPDRGPDGAIRGCYSLAMDISERKRAETALRDSETMLRLAVEATGLGLWDLDLRSGALNWTAPLKALFGLAPDAPVTFALFQSMLHPEDRDFVTAALQAALDPGADGGRFGFEHRICAADGAVRWLLAAGQVAFDESGAPVRVIGTARDITGSKAEQERRALLMAELDHRVKNVLAMVQSIAARTLGEDAAGQALLGRIAALADAHSILSSQEWRGAELSKLLAAVLTAHRTGRSRVSLEGPPVVLPPKLAQSLALALHELTTNAAKYGALSTETGKVRLRWEVAETPRRLRLAWRESGGPPVAPPARQGFGSLLIQRSLAYEFHATVDVQFRPEGLRCEIELPLPSAPRLRSSGRD